MATIAQVVGLLMISQLIARSYAAGHGTGAIAAVGYAFRLYEVPISIIVNPAATILFTLFARLHVSGKQSETAHLIRKTLIWGLILLSPLAMVVALGSGPIVQLVLQRGRFNAQAASLTAEALTGFAPAIVAEAVFIVFFRLFYAVNKTSWSVWISIISIASLVCLLQLTKAGPLFLVSLSVSAGFTVAAACILALLITRFGWTAMPSLRDGILWVAVSVVSISLWHVVSSNLGHDLTAKLLGLFALVVSYLGLISVCFTEYRRDLMSNFKTALASSEA